MTPFRSQEEPTLRRLAFGNERAVRVSQLERIAPFARANTSLKGLTKLEALNPKKPSAA
jgi:hypothetical protein